MALNTVNTAKDRLRSYTQWHKELNQGVAQDMVALEHDLLSLVACASRLETVLRRQPLCDPCAVGASAIMTGAVQPIRVWLLALESAREGIRELHRHRRAYDHAVRTLAKAHGARDSPARRKDRQASVTVKQYEARERQVQQHLRWLSDQAVRLHEHLLDSAVEVQRAAVHSAGASLQRLVPFPVHVLYPPIGREGSAPVQALDAAQSPAGVASALVTGMSPHRPATTAVEDSLTVHTPPTHVAAREPGAVVTVQDLPATEAVLARVASAPAELGDGLPILSIPRNSPSPNDDSVMGASTSYTAQFYDQGLQQGTATSLPDEVARAPGATASSATQSIDPSVPSAEPLMPAASIPPQELHGVRSGSMSARQVGDSGRGVQRAGSGHNPFTGLFSSLVTALATTPHAPATSEQTMPAHGGVGVKRGGQQRGGDRAPAGPSDQQLSPTARLKSGEQPSMTEYTCVSVSADGAPEVGECCMPSAIGRGGAVLCPQSCPPWPTEEPSTRMHASVAGTPSQSTVNARIGNVGAAQQKQGASDRNPSSGYGGVWRSVAAPNLGYGDGMSEE